jgi:hypothetical protein
MRKSLLILPVVLGLAAGLASAGSKQDQSVYIDTVNRNAQGYLGSVRNSTIPNEYIFCSVSTSSSGSKNGYCIATDGRNYLSCNTNDAAMMSTIAALDGDGGIYFAADASGLCTCTFLWTFKSSYIPPKKL